MDGATEREAAQGAEEAGIPTHPQNRRDRSQVPRVVRSPVPSSVNVWAFRRRDPRIVRHQQELKEAKKREKQAKQEAWLKKKAELELKERQEREQRETEAKIREEDANTLRKQKEKEAKELRKARQRLRKAALEKSLSVKIEDMERICARLNLVRLGQLAAVLEASDATAARNAFDEEVRRADDALSSELAPHAAPGEGCRSGGCHQGCTRARQARGRGSRAQSGGS